MRDSYTVHIVPGSSRLFPEMRELWEYRELFFLLVWRDLKVRYKQAVLGITWAVIQPGLTALIFAVVFSRIALVDEGATPYWLIALSGFIIWTFVNSSVSFAGNSLVHHKELVTKIYFPRILVPVSSVGGYFLDLLLTLIILAAGMVYFGTPLTWKLAWVPLVLLSAFLIAASVSILLSSLGVRFRDIKFITPFLLQVWLFISPVIYPLEWVPAAGKYALAVNPLTGCVEAFRHVLFGTQLDPAILLISIASGLVLLILSLAVFVRMEESFADVL